MAKKTKTKTIEDFEKVTCLSCGGDGDLYYDLVSESNIEEGTYEVEIDENRDQVRCILCRLRPRAQDNDLLECEDCQEHYGPFYWAGPDADMVLCKECLEEDLQ